MFALHVPAEWALTLRRCEAVGGFASPGDDAQIVTGEQGEELTIEEIV